MNNLPTSQQEHQSTYDREVERLQSDDKRIPFIRRYFGVKGIFTFVGYPVSLIMCTFLMGMHFYVNFYNTSQHHTGSLVLAALVALAIQVLYYFSSDAFFDGIRAGDWQRPAEGKPNPQPAFFLVGVFTVGIFIFSIAFDLTGAPIVSEYVRSKQNPIEVKLISLDTVNKRYDDQIAEINKKQEEALNTKWKGNITRGAIQLSGEFEESKQQIQVERAAALEDARAQNEQLLIKYNNDTANTAYWVKGGIIVFILIEIVSLWFVSIYNDTAKRFFGKSSIHTTPSGGGASYTGGASYIPGSHSPAPTNHTGSNPTYGASGQFRGFGEALQQQKEKEAARAASYPDYVLFKQTMTDFTVDTALRAIDYWQDQKQKGNTDPVVDYCLEKWQNVVDHYGGHNPAPLPSQSEPAQHTAPHSGHLRTFTDAQQKEIEEVADLYSTMELKQLLREYRSWRRKWTTYNDLRYDQETRDNHRAEAAAYIEAVKQAIRNKGLVPEEVDRLFRKPLVKVEEV